MIVILGLVILVAAVVIGVAGVLGNGGSAHAPHYGFAVFGYHVTGSAGTLFLYSTVAGAARRGLRQSRLETAAASQQRDDLIDQRDTARAYAASRLVGDAPRSRQLTPDNGLLTRLRAWPPPLTHSLSPARPRPISRRRQSQQIAHWESARHEPGNTTADQARRGRRPPIKTAGPSPGTSNW
jgi:hypothetical protein